MIIISESRFLCARGGIASGINRVTIMAYQPSAADRSLLILSRQLIHSRLTLERAGISNYEVFLFSAQELGRNWKCRLIETSFAITSDL